jgi:hypothetical protein
MRKSVNRPAWASEFLLSLNVAWMAVAFELWRPGSLIYKFGGFPLWKGYWLKIGVGPYGVLDQIFWSVILAVVIFLIIRAVTCISSSGRAFRAISGIIVIAGFPMLTLAFWPESLNYYSVQLIEERFPHFLTSLAAIEAALATISAACYALRKWPFGNASSAILLILHFGLWVCLTERWFNPLRTHDIAKNGGGLIFGNVFLMIYYFGLPAIALLASLTWAGYISLASKETSPS